MLVCTVVFLFCMYSCICMFVKLQLHVCASGHLCTLKHLYICDVDGEFTKELLQRTSHTLSSSSPVCFLVTVA